MKFAESQGMALTELIKQAVRQRVSDGALNFSYYPPGIYNGPNSTSSSSQISFSDPNG